MSQLLGSVGSSCLLWSPLSLDPQENPAPICLDLRSVTGQGHFERVLEGLCLF